MVNMEGVKRGKTRFPKEGQKICNDKRGMKTLGEEGECTYENMMRRSEQKQSEESKECGEIRPVGYAKYSSGYILGNSNSGKHNRMRA